MAGATSEAPPEPPAEMMPATLPWRRSQLAKASAIAVTDAPRSAPNTLDPPRPWLSAISCAETSQVESLPLVDTSTSRVRKPCPAITSRMKRSSSPLVSSVPATRPRVADCALYRRAGLALLPGSVFDPRHAGRKRARRGSMRAMGAGCDQRVGSVGLEM